MLHIPAGHIALTAPKSAFAVFRVPLMNLIHGTMAGLMLARAPAFVDPARRSGYSRMFATLLLAIGVKSVLESLQLSGLSGRGPIWVAPALQISILVCVIGGVALALWPGRNVPLPWPELHLPRTTKAALWGLFGVYLLIVATSLWLAHWIPLVT